MNIKHYKTAQWMLWVSSCLPILGFLVAMGIEFFIIGMPEYEREPIAGIRAWLMLSALGIILGAAYSVREKKFTRGMLVIFLNIMSLLFLSAIASSVTIVNTENIRKKNEQQFESTNQYNRGGTLDVAR